MATVGTTSQPNSSTVAYGLNVTNQFGTSVTMPAGGANAWRVTAIGTWFAGWNESARYKLCIWDLSSVALLGQTAGGTIAVQTMSLGNATSVQQNLTSPIIVDGGQTMLVGFHTHSDDGRWLPINSGGTRRQKTTGDSPTSMAGDSSVSGSFNAWIVYEAANAVPTAPSLVSPASGARLLSTDLTPLLDWTHNDPDGDAQTARQIQVDNNSDFSSPVWDSTVSTSTTSASTTTLTAGTTYYWRVRTSDAEGYGPWSGSRSFKINRLPTATKVKPAASAFPTIHNLTDATAWSATGTYAKAVLDWTFSDPDGDAQAQYQVKIYDASSGGTTVYDSGVVSSTSTLHNATAALEMGATYTKQYWWTVRVKDAYEWSAESSRTAFKVRWGQAIYQYQLPSLSTSGWKLTATPSTGGTVAFLYRTASGTAGSGATAWKTSIGSVSRITSGTEYLNVLVRMAPTVVGTNVTLPDMKFTYVAGAIQPDKWVFSSPTTDWMLDPDQRRFGSQALRCSVSTSSGVRYAIPNESTTDPNLYDVSVSPNTEYTFSTYVKTTGPVNADIALQITSEVFNELTELYLDSSKAITRDTSTLDSHGDPLYPEGWQRLSLRFRTTDQSVVRCLIRYGGNILGTATITIGDQFWVDAAQLEESVMPMPWQPGLVGNAAVIDVGGIVVDAAAGGIFRLRGSVAGTRDVVELGTKGLVFGGDVAMYSDVTNRLRLGAGDRMEWPWSGMSIWRSAAFTISSTATFTKVPSMADLVGGSPGFSQNTDCIVIGVDEPDAMYVVSLAARFVNATGDSRVGVGFVTATGADPGSATPAVRNTYLEQATQTASANIYVATSFTVQFVANTWIAMQVWQNVGTSQTADNCVMTISRIGTRNM